MCIVLIDNTISCTLLLNLMGNTKKSVLFICADQWRWDCFCFMKHKYALTPNLDKLAKSSTVFKSHFTGIVPCGPARATMLTGLYPFIHRSEEMAHL